MFDVLTVAAVVDELQATILDGRIQKIGLVHKLAVAMEIYANRRRWPLVMNAETSSASLSLVDRLPSTDPSLITPFGLQLRKYVRGGYLIGIEQPPMERIVRLSIVKRFGLHNENEEDEDTDSGEDDAWSHDATRVDLIVEIMGRHSNLILVDAAGSIMESAKRVTSRMSRVRPILPRIPYTSPPVPDRIDPRHLTSATAGALIANASPKASLADTLVRGLRGVSPQIAREISYVVVRDPAAAVESVAVDQIPEMARTTRKLYQPLLTHSWRPTIYKRDEEPIAYAAIPMSHLAAIAAEESVASISTAITTLAGLSTGIGSATHVQRRTRVIAAIDRETDRVQQRLHGLLEQHERTALTDQYRTWGEMIFAYLWRIQPGDSRLDIDGLEIPLDPALNGRDNALHYFDEYRKSQRAGEQLPERIDLARTELEYLAQLRVQVGQADGFAAIEAIRQEFEEHTGGRQEVGERPGARLRRKESRRVAGIAEGRGNTIYIGRSGRENDQVTFGIAGPEDTWLHARGVPGSHVVIRWRHSTEDEDEHTVETAAALAAYYSGARESGSVEVDVTRRKNVRKIHGAGPGMVTYRNERTIAIRPLQESELKAAGRIS